jgi:DNA-binding NarL/FixJ family response regulator
MTNVYLYSNQPVSAKGLDSVLAATGRFRLEFFSTDLPALLARLATDRPHVVLLDIEPELLFATLADIQSVTPNCRLVLWVNSIPSSLAFQAMALGVRGILRKTLPAELHVRCLEKVSQGELWFEKALTDSFLSARRVNLSPREGQLVTLLSHGLKNKEIAYQLQISEGTVKVYLSRLFHKVGVEGRFELALYGLKNAAAGQWQTGGDSSDAPAVAGLRSLMLENASARPEHEGVAGREIRQ